MAEPLVRDMYEGLDLAKVSDFKKKKHREDQLSKNPDVLFRISDGPQLHELLFSPSSVDGWRRVIRENIKTGPSFELSVKDIVKDDLAIITISGKESELEDVCRRFPELLNMVTQNREARPQQDEIEELRARVEKLEVKSEKL